MSKFVVGAVASCVLVGATVMGVKRDGASSMMLATERGAEVSARQAAEARAVQAEARAVQAEARAVQAEAELRCELGGVTPEWVAAASEEDRAAYCDLCAKCGIKPCVVATSSPAQECPLPDDSSHAGATRVT